LLGSGVALQLNIVRRRSETTEDHSQPSKVSRTITIPMKEWKKQDREKEKKGDLRRCKATLLTKGVRALTKEARREGERLLISCRLKEEV